MNDRGASSQKAGATTEQAADARRFAGECQRLELALKTERPKVEFPESLHTDIMRAVRVSSRASAREPQIYWPYWRVAAAVTVLVAVLMGLHFHPLAPAVPKSSELSSLAMAGSALDLGRDMVREAPAKMLSPLARETEYLNHDLDSAGQFLIASLP